MVYTYTLTLWHIYKRNMVLRSVQTILLVDYLIITRTKRAFSPKNDRLFHAKLRPWSIYVESQFFYEIGNRKKEVKHLPRLYDCKSFLKLNSGEREETGINSTLGQEYCLWEIFSQAEGFPLKRAFGAENISEQLTVCWVTRIKQATLKT